MPFSVTCFSTILAGEFIVFVCLLHLFFYIYVVFVPFYVSSSFFLKHKCTFGFRKTHVDYAISSCFFYLLLFFLFVFPLPLFLPFFGFFFVIVFEETVFLLRRFLSVFLLSLLFICFSLSLLITFLLFLGLPLFFPPIPIFLFILPSFFSYFTLLSPSYSLLPLAIFPFSSSFFSPPFSYLLLSSTLVLYPPFLHVSLIFSLLSSSFLSLFSFLSIYYRYFLLLILISIHFLLFCFSIHTFFLYLYPLF